ESFAGPGRRISARAELAEVGLAEMREALWGALPDSLLYVELDGRLSSTLSLSWEPGSTAAGPGARVRGQLTARDVRIAGEYGEYAVGPINGTIPIALGPRDSGDPTRAPELAAFEPAEFERLRRQYVGSTADALGPASLTVGEISYGFPLLQNLEAWLSAETGVMEIARFGADAFGGRLSGAAVVDASSDVQYNLGLLCEGVRLSEVCRRIAPIEGYLSGCVDGSARLRGTRGGLSGVVGRADFWTYSRKGEKTKISKRLLEKIASRSMKMVFGDREFDRGIMSLYMKEGWLIFKELEISNRNLLGVTDLSVKVVPLNNRIAIDRLAGSITAAAQRAGAGQPAIEPAMGAP
ncbi:MAG: hypothetical protein AB1640_25055, partial [bacterium]